MDVKIKVTKDRYEEIVSIEDSINFMSLSIKEVYEYMVQFVVNEEGEYIPPDEARKLFKSVPRKELPDYTIKFMKAIGESFVNPTSGAE